MAAGDTLCPFRRTTDDSSVLGPSSIAADPALPGSCWDGPCRDMHGKVGEVAAVPPRPFLADGLEGPSEQGCCVLAPSLSRSSVRLSDLENLLSGFLSA